MEKDKHDPSNPSGPAHVTRRTFIENMGLSSFVAAFLGKDALSADQQQSLLEDADRPKEDTISNVGDNDNLEK